VTGVACTVNDVTDRCRASEWLRDQFQLVYALFKSISVPFVMKGMDERYLRVNKAYCDLLSVTAADLRGNSLRHAKRRTRSTLHIYDVVPAISR